MTLDLDWIDHEPTPQGCRCGNPDYPGARPMARLWWRDGAYVPLTHDEWGRIESDDLLATLELSAPWLMLDQRGAAMALYLCMKNDEPAEPGEDYTWAHEIHLGRPWEDQT